MDTITPPPASAPYVFPSLLPMEDFLREEYEARKTAYRNRPIKPRDIRNGNQILLAVKAFVAEHGSEHLGFMTLTFRGHRSWNQAMAAFKLATPFLKKEFPGGWIRIIDLTQRGVIHLHLLVHVPFDINEGFNHEASDRIHELDRLGKRITAEEKAERAECRRQLTTNPQLIDLCRRVRQEVTRCGFGWKLELTPIRETAEIAAKYLLKGMYATIRLRKKLPKNARIFDYAGTFPRVEAPPTKGQIRYRQQRAFVLAAIGETPETMRQQFSRWSFQVFRILDELTYWFGRDSSMWSAQHVVPIAMEMLEPYRVVPYEPPMTMHDDIEASRAFLEEIKRRRCAA